MDFKCTSNNNIAVISSTFYAAILGLFLSNPSIAVASEQELLSVSTHQNKEVEWPFDGHFGVFDRQSIQRGFQVYKEVCSACHSIKRIAFRNLKDIGFSEAEIKSLAASYQIHDGPDDQGEMFNRPGKPSDYFPKPFANDNAARAANGGAVPPDLSLIVKARHDGPNYIYSLLTGFEEAPEGLELLPTQHYNKYFPGHKIAMAAPFVKDGQVEYIDGTKASIDQMAKDVVQFLQWAAEPEMEERKKMGVSTLTFMLLFSLVMFILYKRVWRRVK